jgi:L-amino acid N-acyltransferase YncA
MIMNEQIQIRTITSQDYPFIAEIYKQGIATRNATFETSVPDWEKWDKKHLQNCRFVSEEKDKITGWAALSPVSERYVYAGVCEVSVYIHNDHKGKGVGKKLLSALIDESEKNNIWTLQSGIFPENKASIKLHLDLGFREVGRREKIGKLGEVWRDTVLMERRSKLVGMD